MSQMIDNAIALRILSMIVKPFVDTDAYRLGIIDAHGKNLIPMAKLTTSEQKDAYSYLHRLTFNIKKIINKLPGGETKIRNLAAAWFLFQECYTNNTTGVETALLEKVLTRLQNGTVFVQEELLVNEFMQLREDAPVNSGGGTGNATGGTIGGFSTGGIATGGIAGIDRPLALRRKPKRMQKYIVDEDLFKRFSGGKSASRPWKEYLDMDHDGHKAIYDFARKNPKGIIILQHGKEQKAIRFNRTGGGGKSKR